MIQLAVSGGNEATWKAVQARLRGGTIASIIDLHHPVSLLPSCDAVVVASPVRPTDSALEDCLRAGKHLLLAQVPSLSPESMARLFARAHDCGVVFTILNPDRYLPSRHFIKQHLPEKLGEVGLIRMHRWEPLPQSPDGEPPSSLLSDLDLVCWLMGKRPEVVFALRPAGATLPTSMIQIHLGWRAGGMALIDHARCLPSGPGYVSLSIIGFSGAIYADDQHNTHLLFKGGLPQAIPTSEEPSQMAAVIQTFLDGLHNGTNFTALATSWHEVHLVLDAVEQSVASNQAIHLENR